MTPCDLGKPGKLANNHSQMALPVSVESLFVLDIIDDLALRERETQISQPGLTAQKLNRVIAQLTPSPCASGLLSTRSHSASQHLIAAAAAREPGPNRLSVGLNGDVTS
jgi:hypothetical protein